MGNILASERNNTLANINRTRTKWGLSSAGSNTAAGNVASATNDVNNLLAWLREAKSKSGSPATIRANVNVGDIIQSIYSEIEASSNTIYNHCVCNGNCSGSCSGGCQGSCRDRCRDSCERSNCYNSGCSGSCGSGCMSH